MAYYEQSLLSQDSDFTMRVTACVSSEHYANPDAWVWDHRYAMAATPGFAAAYSSALAANVPNPGRDPAVISDAQILSAVQAIGATP